MKYMLMYALCRPPHCCKGRQIQPGQLIHGSVLAYMKRKPGYTPAASLPADRQLDWESIRDGKHADLIEDEAYAKAAELLSSLNAEGGAKDDEKSSDDQPRQRLQEAANEIAKFVSDRE